MTELESQTAGIPLFKDKKVKDGWTLNMVKQNSELLSVSLYDDSGQVIESKMFQTQQSDQIEKLREYISLFEENPKKNYKKMMKIKLR